MIGPCMCGDTCCSSCGPAQGNWRCPICGTWASEVCSHINRKGQLKRQYRKQAEALVKAEDDALYAAYLDSLRYAEEL